MSFKKGMQFSVVAGLFFILQLSLFAQINFDPEADVGIAVNLSPAELHPGSNGKLTISIKLPENIHITSREFGFFFIQPDKTDLISYGEASYPEGSVFEGDKVYRGTIEVSIPFNIAGQVDVGAQIDFSGTIGYQICTEADPIYCMPPTERPYSTTSTIIPGVQEESNLTSKTSDSESLTVEDRLKRALESGSLIALIWIFIGGVLLSFTPCVYPVIPITIAYIGARSEGSRLKGFSLSLVFVLGLALVYSVLGVFAAATGGVFGLSTQNPYVIGFVILIFLVMGAGMMGAFEMTLPASFQTKLSAGKRTGYLGALIVGGTTGLIAAPCVGPVLVALLGWVSSTGSLFLGFIYLFVFACGLGLLFVVIGTFAGVLSALPTAGKWMEKVKHVFGIVLIGVGIYFARSLISDDIFTLSVGLGLLMLSGYLGGFSRLAATASVGARVGRGIAFFVLIAGTFYILLGLTKIYGIEMSGSAVGAGVSGAKNLNSQVEKKAGVEWIYDDQNAGFARAEMLKKPIMVDFWADWCAACKELDHKTFSKPEVYSVINSDFVPLKIDGSKITDEIKGVWKKYGVKGLPTVLFLNHQGEELMRFEAFRTVEQVLPILEKVKVLADDS